MNIDLIPHLADCIDLGNQYAQKYIELISRSLRSMDFNPTV